MNEPPDHPENPEDDGGAAPPGKPPAGEAGVGPLSGDETVSDETVSDETSDLEPSGDRGRSAYFQFVGRAVQFDHLQEWVGKELDGRYVIKELKKSGGQGGIFLGTEKGMFDRPVAIKIVPFPWGSQRESLVREARMLAALAGDDVVRVLAVGGDDRGVWMVMDWLDGQDLRERINDAEPLPWREAFAVAVHVLRVLERIHPREAHFDIKPGNVFVTTARVYKVLDLGYAKLCDPVFGRPDLCVGAGTPRYASPEQLRLLSADYRSDLYSVGATLFYMLTGEPPFKHATTVEALRAAHGAGRLPPPRTLNPALPAVCDEIVGKATAPQPEERYESAAEFRRALEKALKDAAGPGRPSAAWAVAATAAVALAGVALGAVIGGRRWFAGPSPALPGPQPTPASQSAPAAPASQAVPASQRAPAPLPTSPTAAADAPKVVRGFVWVKRPPDDPLSYPLGDPVESTLVANQDQVWVTGQFDRPVQWYILWHDTKGVWRLETSSDGNGVKLPGERVVWQIDPADPPGVHALFVVAGAVSKERLERLIEQQNAKPAPPPQALAGLTVELRSPIRIERPAESTADEYLGAVAKWLPAEFTTVYCIPLQAKQSGE